MGKDRFTPIPKPPPFFRLDMDSLPIGRLDSATYANTPFNGDADTKVSIMQTCPKGIENDYSIFKVHIQNKKSRIS